MSFSGSSNPPWQRNTLGNAGQPNSAMANMQAPQQMMNTANFVGFQGLTMSNAAPQNANLALIPQLGANMNAMNNSNALFANHQTVQYQNRPALNPNAFGPVQTAQQILHPAAQSQSNQAAQNSVASQLCNSAAFKWNTNLVQQVAAPSQAHGMNMRSNVNQSQLQHSIQTSQQQQQQRNFPGYSSSQSQSNYANNFERASNSVRSSNHSSSSRQSPPARNRTSPDRSGGRSERTRDDEEARKRRKEREREREKEQEKRDDRSPARRISPRRRTRPIPRYMVQMPKITLNATEADIMELRRRYNNLYVPPYFFYSRIRWSESFPCHQPFSIKKPSAFHIFHKTVENPNGPDNGAVFEADDADDSYSAKVMLMSVPPITEFYRKCFASADEKERDDLVHPSRLISFLVGVFGKNETMAIGGAWSPSLDGPNPDKDPSVLIKTAIRTCKALTGIDLSPCTQWYRFVELYYKRVESVRKGRVQPARTQTVVIFLPDVRSCLPTRFEWDELSSKYKKHLDLKVHSDSNNGKSEERELTVDKVEKKRRRSISIAEEDESAKINDPADDGDADVKMVDESSNKLEKSVATDGDDQQTAADSSDAKAADGGEISGTAGAAAAVAAAAISKDEKSAGGSKIDVIHFSELDVKTMKIQELRDQLDARGLSTKGLKPQLVARLSKTLKTEESESIAAAENQNESNADGGETTGGETTGGGINSSNDVHESASNDSIDIDMADIVVIDECGIDEYDSTKNDSKNESSSRRSSSKRLHNYYRSRRWLAKRYRLPENPQILCHPLQHSSLDKFTCEVRSLSILLDYRPEDTKKHCFEVSLFAELFNEMLIRDFGFNIYKVLHAMPESESTANSEHDSKDRRDKSFEDEPREKRHRRDHETSGDSKSSKRDETSSSAAGHDKSKSSDADREKDSKSGSSGGGKDSKSRDKDREREREKDKDKDKEKSHRERRISRREEDNSDDERSMDGKKRETKKMITIDPDLLLSFVYFDQTYCGYIFSNHLEELFYALGLRLSRADAKKIINKVAPRSLFYRKLTDKPKDDTPSTIPSESVENVEELGKGNNLMLPTFLSTNTMSNPSKLVVSEQPTIKEAPPPKVELSCDSSPESTTENHRHMVMYNGALIDVEKLLQQLNRSEKAREETEYRLSELNKSHTELQSSNTKAKDKIKDLQLELKSCNRKMSDTESSFSSAHKRCSEYYSLLCGIHDKVNPIVAKNERSSSKKESSNRDKDRRDREKDKNNGSSAKEKDSKEKLDIKAEIKSEKHEKLTEKPEKSDKSEKPDKPNEN